MGLFSGTRPGNLGAVGGRLAPCKHTPNCVSSQADPAGDPDHYVEALHIPGGAADGWNLLLRMLSAMPRVNLITKGADYVHAEFSTRLMGFIDDVEFLQAGEVIHVRSASRLGRSDFGVNRARVESIRARLAAAAAAAAS